MTTTAAERKREQRKRDKELGIQDTSIRVHKDDVEQIRKLAKILLNDRLKNS